MKTFRARAALVLPAGKAHIRMTRAAAIVTIPMGDKIHSDICHGLGPKRLTITLSKPLGDRILYDAGSLPIRRR